MLEVSSQQLRRCDLVSVEGRVDSETTPQLADVLTTITSAGRYKIVLNLSQVSFMSSAGLRQLIETLKECKRWNRGNLVLAELPKNLEDVLKLAGLHSMFTIYDTEVEAVGNF